MLGRAVGVSVLGMSVDGMAVPVSGGSVGGAAVSVTEPDVGVEGGGVVVLVPLQATRMSNTNKMM